VAAGGKGRSSQSSGFGILRGGSEADVAVVDKAFVEALAHIGWTEGRNLRIDYRLAGSNDPEAIRPTQKGLFARRRTSFTLILQQRCR
jgi:hypothetical protein